MLNTFIKLYDIRPFTRKGEEYFTSDLRFAKQIAENDIYPSIENKLDQLEDVILEKYTSFQLSKFRGGYKYTPQGYKESVYFATRISALLYVFNNLTESEIQELKIPVQNVLYGKHRDYYYS